MQATVTDVNLCLSLFQLFAFEILAFPIIQDVLKKFTVGKYSLNERACQICEKFSFRVSVFKSIFLRGREGVTGTLFKTSLWTKINQYLRNLIYLGQNMEYVVQTIKVLENSVHAETNVRFPKTGFSPHPESKQFFGVFQGCQIS